MTSSKNVFQNGRHDGRSFGVPNDGLANPALRRRKSKNRCAKKLKIVIRIVLRYLVVMQSEICQQEESKNKCSFNGSCVNHRQPLSKLAISIYAATVPHYRRWDDLVLNASIDERFAFKETKK